MHPPPLHILIVDESPDERAALRQILDRSTLGPYVVTEADRGDRALAACRAAPPDCVLLGERLPDGAAPALLAALRAQGDLPVVLLAGVANEAQAVAALDHGAQDYLVKGALTPERLGLTIQRAITTVQLTRERDRLARGHDRTMTLLATMLDTLPVGAAVLDERLRIRQVNPALAEMLGRPVAALRGQLLPALWPALAQPLAEPCAQVLADGRPTGPHEVVAAALGGGIAPRIWQVSAHPLALPDTAAPGLCLVVEDVTAQREAAAARAANEQRLRLALAAVGLVAWEWDIAAGVLTFSGATAEILGFAPGRQTRTLAELARMVYPPDLPAYTQANEQALRTGGPYRVQCRMLTDDARLIWVEASGVAQRDGAGHLARIFGVTRDISAEKRSAAALRASEERFHLLAEHAHDVIFRYRLVPTVLLEYLSPAIERLTGFPREAFYDDPALAARLIHPEDLPSAAHIPTDYASLMQPFVFRWLHPDGRTGWVELRSWLVNDEAGRPVALEGIARDITARREAEEALRVSEARYRSLFETMAQGVVYHDAAGQVIMANPAAERILGLSLREMQSRPSLDAGWRAIHEDGTLFAREDFPGRVALRTGQEVHQIVMGIAHPAFAGYRWLTIQAVPQPQNGAPAQVYAIFEDITEQREARRALEYERQRLNAILGTMYEGVIAFQPDGTIAMINAAGQALAGIEGGAMPTTLAAVGTAPQQTPYNAQGQLLPPEDWPANRIRRGESFTGLEICLRPPGPGPERWLVFNGTPVYDERGALILGVVTVQDITRRKQDEAAVQVHAEALSRANAELTRALRLKDEFQAMMSHELRTPLNAVLGITEALDEGLYGPLSAEQRGALALVVQSGRHLLAILSDILDLTHIEAGTATLDRQPVDVDLLCRAAMQFVQPAAQQKGVRLQRSVVPGVTGLIADERRLTQILVNLLDNAIKFTPAGGAAGLEVSVDAARERILLAVWDTGIGIAAEDYPRLFQPFTQVDGRLARAYGGVGLGLTLVKRLVDQHGGSVRLESAPGQGSRFTVSLPWSDDANAAPAPPDPPAPPHAPWARPPQVLLADDHEPTLQLYAELLARQGCRVAVARTGEEALAQVRAIRPDVAVLDIQMPGMDGLAVIRHIRADPAVAQVPIVALTALVMPGDRERCLAAGADAYLAKPAGLRTLIATIRAALRP